MMAKASNASQSQISAVTKNISTMDKKIVEVSTNLFRKLGIPVTFT